MNLFAKVRYVLLVLLCLCKITHAQNQYVIKVFFYYGSKPAKGFEKIEKREFGGFHGGHVSFGIDTSEVSFHHVNGFHIFPHHSNLRGTYERVSIRDFMKDTASEKYTTFLIPLDSIGYHDLEQTVTRYIAKTPYDYAFFGMRCASAAYDLLSIAKVFKPKSRFGIIWSNFYPRLLRRQCFKLAAQNHFQVIAQPGRKSRIWEGE
jgi:hypothetical protein